MGTQDWTAVGWGEGGDLLGTQRCWHHAMVVPGPTLRVEVAVITLFPLRPQKPSELPCKRDPYRNLVRVAHGWLS